MWWFCNRLVRFSINMLELNPEGDKSSLVCVLFSFHLFITSIHSHVAVAKNSGANSYIFQSFAPAEDTSALKRFNTTIIVTNVNASNFNQTHFVEVASDFYEDVFPDSFIDVVILSNISLDTNRTSHQLKYVVQYNYTNLISNAVSDSVILASIGNLSALRIGFGISYTVSENSSSFQFSGDQKCPSLSCNSSYVFCNESDLGLSQTCNSICLKSIACYNNGACVHESQYSSPRCHCISSASTWYVGDHCQYQIEIWMIVLIILGYLLLLAVISIIGCFCCKRSVTKREDSHQNIIADVKKDPRDSKAQMRGSNEKNLINDDSGSINQIRALEPRRTPNVMRTIPEEYDNVASSIESSDNQLEQNSLMNYPEDSSTTIISCTNSESGTRPYNTLQHDGTPDDIETSSGVYNNLEPGSKSTQTHAALNVHLPDSILQSTI